MFVGLVAWLCSLSATLLPSWLTRTTELLVAESYETGLWESCLVHEGEGIECRAYETLLGLPHNLTMARICMCMSDAIALLGILIAVPGLNLVKGCGGSQERQMKRGIKISAAVLVVVAGIIELYSVSTVAYDVFLRFHDHHVPHTVPRWEFGTAMFIGWSGGFLYVISAALFFVSSCGLGENEIYIPPHAYHYKDNVQPINNNSTKKIVEYV